MKKIFIIMTCILSVLTVNAQWKSGKGALLGEVSYNFGNGTGLVNGGLKGRYFLKDRMAARIGLNIGTSMTENTYFENLDGTGASGTATNSFTNITFAPGIEFHTKGNDKLSPYFGAELPIMSGSNSIEKVNSDNDIYRADYKSTMSNSSTGFGLRLLAGADWYITEGMYLGFEFGWGYMMTTNGDTETSITTGGNTSKNVRGGGTSSNLSATTTGGLRLGVRF